MPEIVFRLQTAWRAARICPGPRWGARAVKAMTDNDEIRWRKFDGDPSSTPQALHIKDQGRPARSKRAGNAVRHHAGRTLGSLAPGRPTERVAPEARRGSWRFGWNAFSVPNRITRLPRVR